MRFGTSLWAALRLARSPNGTLGPAKRRLLGLAPTPIVAMGLSLIPLLLIFQVSSGMIEGITLRYIETGSYHLQLSPWYGNEEVDLVAKAQEIASLDLRVRAWPEIQGGGLLGRGSSRTLVQVRGVDAHWLSEDPHAQELFTVEAGSFDLSSHRSVVLGTAIAQQLQVALGDRVVLTTVRSGGSGSSIPRVMPLEVVGIVTTGYRDLDRSWIFMNYSSAARTLEGTATQSLVGIKIDDPFSIANPLSYRPDQGTDRLLEQMEGFQDEQWQLQSWYQANEGEFVSFMTTRSLLVFISSLVVLVSAVTISSALVLMTMEKERDIALLRTLGLGPRRVMGLYVLVGLAAGGLGTLGGSAFGAIVSLGINEILSGAELIINGFMDLLDPLMGTQTPDLVILSPEFYLERIPVAFRWSDVAVSLGVGFLSSLLASIVPAIRASRISPTQLLRKT